MAVAHIDRVDNLTCVERQGVIRSLTRKARVAIATADNPNGDYNALNVALLACPAPFTTLPPPYDALVLVEREPAVVENDPGWVDVLLKYEHIMDGPNQRLFAPPAGVLYGKGKCSITEKTTNFYYPYGDPRNGKALILTGHVFLPSEGAVGPTAYPGLPNLVVQSGEVTIPFPESNYTVVGVMAVEDPMTVANQFVACVNKNPWMGKPSFSWICSEVQWEVLYPSTLVPANRLYKFSLEFQFNIDTWYPYVVFQDQRTGKPPAGVKAATLADGAGVLSLNYYPFSSSIAAAAAAAYATAFAAAIAAGFNVNIADSLATVAAATAAAAGGQTNQAQPVLPSVIPNFPANAPNPGLIIPAGLWQVPCLPAVDFDQLLSSVFEGDDPTQFG